MPTLLEHRDARSYGIEATEMSMTDLNALVLAMGKRLQSEYVDGAIPYFREHEPALWARLEVLDQEDTVAALLEYERLFFEGLHRYIRFLEGERRAA
jgi:hypothetical protein